MSNNSFKKIQINLDLIIGPSTVFDNHNLYHLIKFIFRFHLIKKSSFDNADNNSVSNVTLAVIWP